MSSALAKEHGAKAYSFHVVNDEFLDGLVRRGAPEEVIKRMQAFQEIRRRYDIARKRDK